MSYRFILADQTPGSQGQAQESSIRNHLLHAICTYIYTRISLYSSLIKFSHNYLQSLQLQDVRGRFDKYLDNSRALGIS